MKKFFAVAMFAAMIFLAQSQAEAREVYVGTYGSGSPGYLMTETIRRSSTEATCKVKVYGPQFVYYVDYKFGKGGTGSWWYENSLDESGRVFSAPEYTKNVARYVLS